MDQIALVSAREERIAAHPPRILVYGAGLLVLLIALAYALGRGKPAPQTRAANVPTVTAVAPGLRSVTDVVSFTGTIAARDEMPITVEGEGGRVAAILVEVGDRVEKGQVLARLDPAVVAPQVGSLAAALEEARTNADLAEAEYRRADAVSTSGALSAQEIERRRSAAVSARAKVKVAEAQLAESRARLRRTEIRAPQPGVVLTRDAEVGQTVSAGGEPMFRLGRGGEIEMRGRVAEQDLPKLQVGQLARVRVTGVEQPFEGKVRLLGAVIDPQTRLGSIRIDLAPHPNLRPGAFARAQVEVGRAQRPVVPQTAVLSDPRGTYVLAIDAQNKVVRHDVRVAGVQDEGIVIDRGLDGRERVVSTAAAYLRVGETVTLAGEGGKAAAGQSKPPAVAEAPAAGASSS